MKYVGKQRREIKVGAVHKNGNQTYIIEIKDEHANVLYIELAPNGEYYNVNSGGVFRADYTKNKKAVEPLPAFEVSPAAADKEVQEQGGSPMSGNSSSTVLSEGKDNGFLANGPKKETSRTRGRAIPHTFTR